MQFHTAENERAEKKKKKLLFRTKQGDIVFFPLFPNWPNKNTQSHSRGFRVQIVIMPLNDQLSVFLISLADQRSGLLQI